MATLAQDPSYLAYMRALGFEQASAQNQAALGQARAGIGAQFQAQHIQDQEPINQETIAGNFEDRGLYRSGEYLKASARQAADTQYQLGNLALGTTDTIAGISSDLASKLSSLNRQQAEQNLNIGGQLYLNPRVAPYGG